MSRKWDLTDDAICAGKFIEKFENDWVEITEWFYKRIQSMTVHFEHESFVGLSGFVQQSSIGSLYLTPEFAVDEIEISQLVAQ